MRQTLVLVAVALFALPAAAEKKLWTPYDVARLGSVGTAEISPDSEHVAVVTYRPRTPIEQADGGAWTELHVVDADGNARPFITGKQRIGGVKWTTDGKGIAFLAKRGDDTVRSLYVIPLDGGEAQRVFEVAGGISSYSFSPDGTSIAYLSPVKGDNGAGKLKSKGFTQEVYEEDRGTTAAWVAPLDGSSDPKKLEVVGRAYTIDWAPKGDAIAISAAPTPLVDDEYMQTRVGIYSAKTGKKTASIDNPGKLGRIAWSTDGKRLAMVSGADINDPRAGRILVAPATGGKGKFLLMDYDGHVNYLAWRDSKTIAYMADTHVLTAIGQIRYDGSRHKTLLEASGPWSGLSLAKDGDTFATVGESPAHPREAFRGELGDDAPKRLTDTNPWLKDMAMGAQSHVVHKAKDGTVLEGILIKPVGYQEGTRYPLVLHVHGGPESHVRNGWVTRYAYLGQLGASRGFAIFYPNYRGSTARGLAFSKTSQADPAGKEFDDLVEAVDHLVAEGIADTNRIGISGGSYGGYATAWASTRFTDRFHAGVMFVGISNKISKAGTTDIANEEFYVHTRKRPWDHWQFFLERSPIYYVKQAKTPLLIAHGKDDPRVNKGQAMELYRHLKVIGQAPVRLVFYPGEGHGNRRAASRLDFNLRLLRWMEHFLKNDGKKVPPKGLDYEKLWKATK